MLQAEQTCVHPKESYGAAELSARSYEALVQQVTSVVNGEHIKLCRMVRSCVTVAVVFRLTAGLQTGLRRQQKKTRHGMTFASKGESDVKGDVGSPMDRQPLKGGSSGTQVQIMLLCVWFLRHQVAFSVMPGVLKPWESALQESSKPAASGSGQQQSLQDLPEYPEDFVRRRLVVFVGIVIG